MWYWDAPRLVFGEDAVEYLEQISGKRAFIVTDKIMVDLGFVEIVQKKLQKANIESTYYDEVEPDPSVQTAKKGVELCREYKPDWIIGLGGGSPMDVAKAIDFMYENPDMKLENLSPFIQFKLHDKCKIIQIPTTSGTGAEITWAVVLTDLEEKRKLLLASREIVADVAIIDPQFPAKMPPKLTSSTGLDALTHAVEGYVSIWGNIYSDAMCEKAVELIFQNLETAVEDGSNMEARENMHNAATMAGLGFGNSQAGIAHSMGHSIGAVLHKPHGFCVGIALPYTMDFNISAEGGPKEKYAILARKALSISEKDDFEASKILIEKIKDVMKNVGAPLSYKEFEIPKKDFEENFDLIVLNADQDSCTATSRPIPTREEFQMLLRKAYEGE
ncbi:MAG: iron-containing alcohol dehydrogenase [Promethearchaeota archaeon]|nr:MAG: iron-containing alcohol dehydrogenase [Candidatus Lokiarchaeota archaeon]